ncbi:MAG: beta-ketoacyl synthase N-terminal-like domain-containing protein [Planctomycetota bacterium]
MRPTDDTTRSGPRAHPRQTGLITGLGAVTPLGIGVPSFVSGLRRGARGARLLDFERSPGIRAIGATCNEWSPDLVMRSGEAAKLPRLVPMALAAARQAMEAAGLGDISESETEAQRVGLILGTGGGGIDFTGEQYRARFAGQRPSLWTITNATHGNLAGELSIRLGLRGPSLCVSTGCASGSDAAGLALDQLRAGRVGSPEAWVVIGADAHVRPEPLAAMDLLGVISQRACASDAEAAAAARPFDTNRDGFVLSEGAWAMVLQRRDDLVRTDPIGQLMGYGATCDAFHRVRPDPDMGECARAIDLAIQDAGVSHADVNVAHYHGTATVLNDRLETDAFKRAFGSHARRIVGHSIKGAIGHPQGASGMASLVATLGAMAGLDGDDPFTPPTANLSEPDDVCDLDYTPHEARACAPGATALISCLAFGAKNSMLVVRSRG